MIANLITILSLGGGIPTPPPPADLIWETTDQFWELEDTNWDG